MIAAVAALAASAGYAQSYRPSFHPDALKGPPPGKPNEVMVLGTPHLSGLPKDVDLALLAPLLDRLAAWKPTGIATEDLSEIQCDTLRRYPARYADTVKSYCWDPAPAARATGLDVPAATTEAERVLATWPASPSAAQRRRLAAVFLAAGERGSAYVQWLRLPATERRAGDGLDEALVAHLGQYAARRNETAQIAAALAARLGLERLWSVDDHSADTPDDPDPAVNKAAGQAIMAAWRNPWSAARHTESDRLTKGLGQPGGVLALYRAVNAPREADLAYRGDFGAALVEPSPQQFGRNYVGYWETRNLRMVANIREVLGRYPGMRMLAIVGASHKGYYEAYLNQMHDVRLVDTRPMLR
ncbi:hypothetical protein GGQ80_002225 [Sphingomonas jinjuensis]|uniref:Uncharacterized protein n=2 Tax=Sphingomonas jinjuensis TaxID=535907 RepID=A0A840FCD9_9SPHN|nr:hypothetical protein [Sphingomonas jinjuensis]